MSKYDKIINHVHHVSKKRAPMSMHDRAAQFAPFEALVGYGDAVVETARLTDAKAERDEDRAAMLDRVQAQLEEIIRQRPRVTVEYFVPDGRKQGGAYVKYTGNLRRIDNINRKLIFEDRTELGMEDIYSIAY